mmetsp:Transcript_1229/g.3463  ORF Transcript_1229/g.3463 Transcript_1229/m.3463 type:complete len:83 (+) Transcript_1229:1149-1397(+)
MALLVYWDVGCKQGCSQMRFKERFLVCYGNTSNKHEHGSGAVKCPKLLLRRLLLLELQPLHTDASESSVILFLNTELVFVDR